MLIDVAKTVPTISEDIMGLSFGTVMHACTAGRWCVHIKKPPYPNTSLAHCRCAADFTDTATVLVASNVYMFYNDCPPTRFGALRAIHAAPFYFH